MISLIFSFGNVLNTIMHTKRKLTLIQFQFPANNKFVLLMNEDAENKFQLIQQNADYALPSICFLCSQAYQDMSIHIRQCPGISPDELEEKQTFYRLTNRGNICKFCWTMFSPKDWQYHRKTQACRKKKSINDYFHNKDLVNQVPKSLPERKLINPSLGPSLDNFRSQNKVSQRVQIHEVEDPSPKIYQNQRFTTVQFADFARSLLHPMLRQWLFKNQSVDVNVLLVHFNSALIDFGLNFFQKTVIVPTWSSIAKVNSNINWQSILEKPENLFNQKFIDNKLQKMTLKKQARIIKALNKLGRLNKGLIKHREVPTIRRQPKFRKFIHIKDIFLVIKQLLQSGKKNTIHFGLDLYIILLSGQRYLADHVIIQAAIITLLSQNRKKSKDEWDFIYTMSIGKTSAPLQVCLNSQLCCLLQEFQWNGFHLKTHRTIERMSQWLGVSYYSLKDTIMSIATLNEPNIDVSQRIAGHASTQNTKRYVRGALIAANLSITSKLVVPGLHPRFGSYSEEQILSYFNSLTFEHIRYAKFSEGWFEKLLSRLYTVRYQKQLANDQNINFLPEPLHQQISDFHLDINIEHKQSQQMLQSKKRQRHEQQQCKSIKNKQENHDILEHQQKDEQNENQMQSYLNRNRFFIYGNLFTFSDGKFKKEEFFQNTISYEKVQCRQCKNQIESQNIRFQCIFCSSHLHPICSKLICSCMKEIKNTMIHSELQLVPSQINRRKQYIKINMPQKYIRDFTKQEESIQILLSLRRFQYTRVPIITPGYSVLFPANYYKNLKESSIKNYKFYLNGKYFPPIQVLPIEKWADHSIFGSQFGIFATQQINQNVFIGEYACDLMNGKQLGMCKKNDAIMEYSGKQTSNDVFLAPKDYAGYITLLNTGESQEKNNCNRLRTIINGQIRVIIYTKRKIEKGQELLYQYGRSYKFQVSDLPQ